MSRSRIIVCPTHGEVQATYRPECFWWECPGIVDCGFTVAKEAVIMSDSGCNPGA